MDASLYSSVTCGRSKAPPGSLPTGPACTLVPWDRQQAGSEHILITTEMVLILSALGVKGTLKALGPSGSP